MLEWLKEPPDSTGRMLWLQGGSELLEFIEAQPLRCRYLDAPLPEVTGRMPAGMAGKAYEAELWDQIKAATLCRVEFSYSLERPPAGRKLIGVCRAIQILPAREGGEITEAPRVPVRDLIRRFIKDVLTGTPAEPRRRFGKAKTRDLERARDAYLAAPRRGTAAAVAEALQLSDDTGDQLNAARQLIWEARQAGLLPSARGRAVKYESRLTEHGRAME